MRLSCADLCVLTWDHVLARIREDDEAKEAEACIVGEMNVL